MAAINIYVGNLSFKTNEEHLRELFETYGQVESATIISDKFTGCPGDSDLLRCRNEKRG